ncbi:glycosyltransferase [Pseudomonas stutzeri]|uniref:glycosyltransferase n=1 Tax=Stutzerimonas stutzeri TaxID=316 RepID=UPI00210CBBAE|nr:glycosyltransferase [Stutzerimonas stutzeri]MCQ4313478.1 glycosyltransferase [Stutzerimonas stutzeri]
MTPKTTVVTVTYGDRLAYLQLLVERALAFTEISEVIVVSNAALAPLEQLLERWPGQVRLIQLQHNTGSANGYAVAIEAALAGGADYIWMMDDDNAPTAAAVSILHRELARLIGLLGPDRVAVLGYRATQQADIAQGVPTRYILQPRSSYFGFHIAQMPYKLWRRLPWTKRPGKRPASISLPFAPYGGMLAHRSLYQRIGVPLKELVLYVDDTEYTRRITAGGGRLFLFTDAVIDELEQSWNIKDRTRNIYETFLLGNSDFRAYYAARNQAWFDKNIWAASPRLHRLNRAIFLTLLRLVARLRNTRERLTLIEQAIHDGENGALGISKTFPLR